MISSIFMKHGDVYGVQNMLLSVKLCRTRSSQLFLYCIYIVNVLTVLSCVLNEDWLIDWLCGKHSVKPFCNVAEAQSDDVIDHHDNRTSAQGQSAYEF